MPQKGDPTIICIHFINHFWLLGINCIVLWINVFKMIRFLTISLANILDMYLNYQRTKLNPSFIEYND